jgi:hypothetical protein
MRSVLLLSSLLIFTFSLTFFFVQKNQSTNSNTYRAPLEVAFSRSPSSITKDFDFSDLSQEAQIQSAKKRFISSAQVIKSLKSKDLGIQFGNFLMNSSGSKVLACSKFSKFILVFEGEGESSNRAQMQVEAPCMDSQNINLLETVWIPIDNIRREPAADGEFMPQDSNLKFNFTNLSADWPKSWKLVSVRLISKNNSAENISIASRELSNYRELPIIISF